MDLRRLHGNLRRLHGDLRRLHGDLRRLHGDLKRPHGDLSQICGDLQISNFGLISQKNLQSAQTVYSRPRLRTVGPDCVQPAQTVYSRPSLCLGSFREISGKLPGNLRNFG